MSIEQQPPKHTTNPDIAETTEQLKALHAQPDAKVPVEHQDDRKDGMSLKTKAGLLLAGLGIAGTAGFVGKSLAGGGEASPAPTTPEASAPVTPGPAETQAPSPEVETEMDKYGINVADYPTFEEAVKAFYQKKEEYYASSSDKMDQPGDSKYLDALFGPDWASSDELGEYVSDTQALSVIISTNHFATGENGTTEYEHTIQVTGVEDVSEGSGQVAGLVTVHTTDNIMDTVLAMNNTENLDDYAQFHLTFTDVDGYWQVTEVDNLNDN